jgi:hypothetical protein
LVAVRLQHRADLAAVQTIPQHLQLDQELRHKVMRVELQTMSQGQTIVVAAAVVAQTQREAQGCQVNPVAAMAAQGDTQPSQAH